MRSLVIYRNETALHLGTGTEIGYVDMPIQREKSTGFPKGEASSIKGVFRDMCTSKYQKQWFGDENKEQNSMGLLKFTDARILFFPVRTLDNRLCVWITCPFIIARFLEDTKSICTQDKEWKKFNDEFQKSSNSLGKLGDAKCISIGSEDDIKNLSLMEYTFEIEKKEKIKLKFPISLLKGNEGSYLGEKISKNLFVVSDEIFSYFSEMGTEVITRIRIGEDGVVINGGLFTEEFLPENTMLYNVIEDIEKRYRNNDNEEVLVEMLTYIQQHTLVQESNMPQEIKAKNKYTGILQLGGGKTLGKGITSFIANVYKEEYKG